MALAIAIKRGDVIDFRGDLKRFVLICHAYQKYGPSELCDAQHSNRLTLDSGFDRAGAGSRSRTGVYVRPAALVQGSTNVANVNRNPRSGDVRADSGLSGCFSTGGGFHGVLGFHSHPHLEHLELTAGCCAR